MSNVISIENRQAALEAELYAAEISYYEALEAYNAAKKRLDEALAAIERYV